MQHGVVVRRQSRYPLLSIQTEHKTMGAVQNATLDLFSPLPVGRDLLGGPVPLILSPLLQQRVTIVNAKQFTPGVLAPSQRAERRRL